MIAVADESRDKDKDKEKLCQMPSRLAPEMILGMALAVVWLLDPGASRLPTLEIASRLALLPVWHPALLLALRLVLLLALRLVLLLVLRLILAVCHGFSSSQFLNVYAIVIFIHALSAG